MKTSTLALAGAVLGSFLSVSAWAFPVSTLDTQAAPGITLVAQGCGPGFHRGAFGKCRPNEAPRACPPRWHWAPLLGRCVR